MAAAGFKTALSGCQTLDYAHFLLALRWTKKAALFL
jgi:hypothetical protein